MEKAHSFHIPVMGIGFTVDTPVKVAQYGIDSVVSIVDDILLEGFQVMLMGDFNMDLSRGNYLIEELEKRGIIDVMKRKLNYTDVPNTRYPGSKPID